jgi:4-aminobutyrate aminotransferase
VGGSDVTKRRAGSSQDWIARGDRLISPAARIPYYPLVVKSARGSTIEDSDRRTYLDFLSAACIANTGHNHPKVVEAVKKQADRLLHYNLAYAYTEEAVELAEELCRITPGTYGKRVAFGLSGSDANDCAIKLLRQATRRPLVISYLRSYHGVTYGALSLSAVSLPMRRYMGPTLPGIFHAPYPDCYRCQFGGKPDACNMACFQALANLFETSCPPEEVAGIIIEPIQGDAGVIVPPPKYMAALREACDKHGILLVSEEVQSGFGRTGRWFAIEKWPVEPDLVVMGKAMASGMPLSAVVGRRELFDRWEAPGHALSTSANPVSCAASLATIKIIEEEGLLEKARESGEYMKARFLEMADRHPLVGDVRGEGLMLGVDLVSDRDARTRAAKETAKVAFAAWQRGLFITFFSRSVLRVAPPLVITREEVDTGLRVLEESLSDVEQGKVPDSVLSGVKGW